MTEDKLAALGLIGLLSTRGDTRSAQLQQALQWHFLANEDLSDVGAIEAGIYEGDDDTLAVMVGNREQLRRWRLGTIEHFKFIPINPPAPSVPICQCCGRPLSSP